MKKTKREKILYIIHTAIMLSILIIMQFLTNFLPAYVTGVFVNLLLILSVFLVGLTSGLTLSIFSPFLAFLLGIGPALLPIVPFIIFGNIILVLVSFAYKKITNSKNIMKIGISILGVIVGACAKALFLWVGVVLILLPNLSLNEGHLAVLSFAFSYQQLITATIGGMIAISISPLISKANQGIYSNKIP